MKRQSMQSTRGRAAIAHTETGLQKEQRQLIVVLVGLAGAACVFLGLQALEYALAHSIFSFLKEAMPGEENTVSVALLSFIPLAMFICFHAFAGDDSDGPLVLTVRRTGALFLFIWAIGAGGTLGATIYYDGVDTFFSGGHGGDPAGGVQAFFTQAAAEVEPGPIKAFLEDHALAFLGACFVLGAIGVTLCIMYLCHCLIQWIRSNLDAIHGLLAANDALREIQRIYELQKRRHAIAERSAELERQISRAELDVAGRIAGILNRAVLEAREMMCTQEAGNDPRSPHFILREKLTPAAGANIDAINRWCAHLTAYANTQSIIADIRAHTELEEESK